MKKTIMTMMVCLCCVLTAKAQTYWDGTADKVFAGSGTQEDPYLISTPEQLAGLAERTNTDKEDFAGKYIRLTADIYLTDFSNANTETWRQWHPIAHEWWRRIRTPTTVISEATSTATDIPSITSITEVVRVGATTLT